MTLTMRTFGSSVLFSGHAVAAAASTGPPIGPPSTPGVRTVVGGDQHRQSGTDSTVRYRVKARRARLRSSLAGLGYLRFGGSFAGPES